ncbi:putative nitrogen fixation protein NifT [Verrucomicrobium sp. 3C]|uniref:putative nitrogen fixation protein NifT n=1 Tax=Verrucomicrobium sp. 3C TaxID=1134055 RepID=UPI000379CEC6|nr:putative nitrogen fixation protein NifT [Verrucomicrobium sp. 3C]MDD2676247.1 putative nitrogen fixation protein NifT [Candidatus Methylacidiphilaceae bacterium]
MKIMIRRAVSGLMSVYVAKKDLEEPVVAVEKPGLWGGTVTLANGWRFQLPEMPGDTPLPITVEARRLAEGAGE